MLLPYCPVARAAGAGIRHACCTARRQAQCRFARHERALLAPAETATDYIERAIGHKKLKELRRQKRRLGDSGVVMWSLIASEPAALASALSDFLALEAAGWKGRAGTAARNDPDIRTFMETAVPQLAGEGKARIARLFLDTRAIAAIIMLRSGDTEWCWKIAYDESMARASPGVQLLLDVTQAHARRQQHRARRFLRHPRPSDDRPHLARAPRPLRIGSCGRPRAAGQRLSRWPRALEAARRAAVAGAKRVRDLVKAITRAKISRRAARVAAWRPCISCACVFRRPPIKQDE